MNISKELALEILNLNEDFSSIDLNREFDRLTKLTQSDANLFRLITTCKEVLLKKDLEEENTNFKHTSSPNDFFDKCVANSSNQQNNDSRKKNITLSTLYNIIDTYQYLSTYEKQYDIQKIISSPIISLYGKNNSTESLAVNLITTYLSYTVRGFIYFYKEIDIPDSLKNSKKINIKIDFMDKWYKFTISKNKNSVEFSYTKEDTIYRKYPNTVVQLKFIF